MTAFPNPSATAAASFALDYDEVTDTLEMVMAGFWSLPVYEEFTTESQRWINALRARRRWFALLVDNTKFVVQSPEISAALSTSVERASLGHRAPTALVVEGALSRLQAKRIGAADHVAIFTDFSEARRWIEAKKRDTRDCFGKTNESGGSLSHKPQLANRAIQQDRLSNRQPDPR